MQIEDILSDLKALDVDAAESGESTGSNRISTNVKQATIWPFFDTLFHETLDDIVRDCVRNPAGRRNPCYVIPMLERATETYARLLSGYMQARRPQPGSATWKVIAISGSSISAQGKPVSGRNIGNGVKFTVENLASSPADVQPAAVVTTTATTTAGQSAA